MGDKAFIGAGDKVYILDVSSDSAPSLVKEITGFSANQTPRIAVNSRYLYVLHESDRQQILSTYERNNYDLVGTTSLSTHLKDGEDTAFAVDIGGQSGASELKLLTSQAHYLASSFPLSNPDELFDVKKAGIQAYSSNVDYSRFIELKLGRYVSPFWDATNGDLNNAVTGFTDWTTEDSDNAHFILSDNGAFINDVHLLYDQSYYLVTAGNELQLISASDGKKTKTLITEDRADAFGGVEAWTFPKDIVEYSGLIWLTGGSSIHLFEPVTVTEGIGFDLEYRETVYLGAPIDGFEIFDMDINTPVAFAFQNNTFVRITLSSTDIDENNNPSELNAQKQIAGDGTVSVDPEPRSSPLNDKQGEGFKKIEPTDQDLWLLSNITELNGTNFSKVVLGTRDIFNLVILGVIDHYDNQGLPISYDDQGLPILSEWGSLLVDVESGAVAPNGIGDYSRTIACDTGEEVFTLVDLEHNGWSVGDVIIRKSNECKSEHRTEGGIDRIIFHAENEFIFEGNGAGIYNYYGSRLDENEELVDYSGKGEWSHRQSIRRKILPNGTMALEIFWSHLSADESRNRRAEILQGNLVYDSDDKIITGGRLTVYSLGGSGEVGVNIGGAFTIDVSSSEPIYYTRSNQFGITGSVSIVGQGSNAKVVYSDTSMNIEFLDVDNDGVDDCSLFYQHSGVNFFRPKCL